MKSVNCSPEFLRRISQRRPSAQGRVTSIFEYIEQGAALLTSENLGDLRTELPPLNLQLAAIEAPQFPRAAATVKVVS